MIRLAAVGDVHYGTDSAGSLRPYFERLPERADMLLIAGDLTRHGAAEEAEVLADDLRALPIPVVSVLGNHDYHQNQENGIRAALEGAGARVLEGEGVVLPVDGARVGVVGTKGFGGGFAGACGTEFGEPEMKAFIGHTRHLADQLEERLRATRADLRVVLLHYSPVEQTLQGERLEIYPFLGSYLLAEAVDRAGADLILHGHAHRGSERGVTPGGVHTRNVAQPVIKHAYALFCFGGRGRTEETCADAESGASETAPEREAVAARA